ncbi:MAG: hypothetical protein ACNI25_08080 [Halarcobacter sp.]
MGIKYLILIAFVSLQCFGNDILSMNIDKFYKIKANQEMYEQMLKNGQIEKSKKMFKSTCKKQAKNKKELEYCDCAALVIDKIDKKLFVYDSIYSYQLFMAKVEAKKNNDEAEYQRLMKADLQRDSLAKMFNKECNIK